MLKNWKTSLFGIASILVYIVSYFFPDYKQFAADLMAILVSVGFLAAKDSDVTGGTRSQP